MTNLSINGLGDDLGSHICDYYSCPPHDISSFVPSEIGNCSSISLLDLGLNNLMGSIHETITRLSKLTLISINSNQIIGAIS